MVGFDVPEKDEHPEEAQHIGIGIGAGGRSKSFASKSLGEGEKTGVQITIHNLTYRVPLGKGQERYLLGGLEPLTGTMDPGQMVALMGSSGAGKSTLMDTISKRKTVGVVEGLILFDGHEPTHGEIGRDTGYVEQKDSLWGTYTVREMLMYTALLKMDKKFDRKTKSARVDEVIEQMGLTKSKNTKIGGALVRGVSGGEAKRISIGLGLLNNPRILFLDEPTSGLDSATSWDVMSTVKDLAEEGRTVLSTIHQPSGKIFGLFDSIILLSRDVDTRSGNIVYFGECGNELKEYFEGMGYKYDANEVDNIAEFVLNIISGGVKGPQQGNELITHFAESEMGELNVNIAEGIAKPLLEDTGAGGAQKMGSTNYYANSMMSEIATILEFRGKSQFKDTFFLASRIGLYIVAALLIASLYAGPPSQGKTPQGLIIVIAILFITVFIGAAITIIYIPSLIIDKPVFIRESNDGCYRAMSYSTANFLIEAASMAISSILFTSILYFCIPGLQRTAEAFFCFMLFHYVFSLTACTITLSMAAPLPSIELAAGAVAVYALFNVSIMGFLSQVPVWWAWACFISYMRWGFAAFMINQFQGQPYDLCSGVPDPMPLGDVLTLATSLGSAGNIQETASQLDVDSIACGLLQIPTYNTSEIADQTCPGIKSLLGSDPTAILTGPAFRCDPSIVQLLSDPMTMDDIYNSLGTVILAFYPQGNNYGSNPKFIELNKFTCFGILCGLLVVSFFLYAFATKVSIRLVKR